MAPDTTFTFAELLKGFRTRNGLSQQQLAEAVARSRGTISNWERGELLPEDRDVVLLLAEELHLSTVETDRLLMAAGYASSTGSPSSLPLPVVSQPGSPAATAPSVLPTGTVTWLLTDIQGSTASGRMLRRRCGRLWPGTMRSLSTTSRSRVG